MKLPRLTSIQTESRGYLSSLRLAQVRALEGEVTFRLDEMTGIQALERKMPDILMKPGRCVQRKFEYIRHGTQTLIASFNVATGAIALATVGATRTEQDFAAHVHLLAQSPDAAKLISDSNYRVKRQKLWLVRFVQSKLSK